MDERPALYMRLLHLLKKTCLGWWIIVPLFVCTPLVICAMSSIQLLFGSRNEIASIDIGDGYTIKIWDEMDGITDPNWDPDHSGPDIYYQITKSGSVVIPTTYLTSKYFDSPYNIKVAFANDGKLVCVYDTGHWDRGIFVMFDLTYQERWSIGIYQKEERQRWIDRYNLLKQANPDLPPYYG